MRVLVTNARRRNTIPIVRALGEASIEVACMDCIPQATAFYSRYCSLRLVHPPPEATGEFLACLLLWLRKNPCDAIFPIDDDVLMTLSEHRGRLPRPDTLLLPDHETMVFVNDKASLIPYAGKMGLGIPQTIIVRRKEDLSQLREIECPVIIKPAMGSGSRGLVRVRERGEMRAFCEQSVVEGRTVLVQEIIPPAGEGLGYFALYSRDHRLIAQFMHRRLREYPLAGGPSTLREGIWDESLAIEARRLLESLQWVGLAMVEFKRDVRDGRHKLMEINPRLWGSIALPIFSGVNFPVLAANVTAGIPVEPVLSYETSKLARWLWPGDILHLLASLRQGRWPKGFLRFYDRNMCYDILSLRDPGPAWGLTLSVLRELCSVEGWRRNIKRGAP